MKTDKKRFDDKFFTMMDAARRRWKMGLSSVACVGVNRQCSPHPAPQVLGTGRLEPFITRPGKEIVIRGTHDSPGQACSNDSMGRVVAVRSCSRKWSRARLAMHFENSDQQFSLLQWLFSSSSASRI
jgi:hypothetical protein